MITDRIMGPEPFSTRNSHGSRQRLKPWLKEKIDSGECPGLQWMDLEKRMFKIPWKHFGKPGVDGEIDAKVFRDWAIHTGKYRDGDPPDPSTWKTRFRCALYKLPDIEEQAKLNVLDGESPYRVYKFLTKEEVLAKEASRGDSQHQNDLQIVLSPASSVGTDTEGGYSMSSVGTGSYGQDLSEFDSSFLDSKYGIAVSPDVPLISSFDDEVVDITDTLDLCILDNAQLDDNFIGDLTKDGFDNPDAFIQEVSRHPPELASATAAQSQLDSQGQPERQGTEYRTLDSRSADQAYNLANFNPLRVQVFYKGKDVADRLISNPDGLRCAFERPPPLPEDVAKDDSVSVVAHIYGPFQAEQLYFPTPQDASVAGILQHARRGLVLQAQNGNIYATRLCRAKIFYSSSFSGSVAPSELAREVTTKVFDIAVFESQLLNHIERSAPRPSFELFFSIGQRWDSSHSLRDNLVYIAVTHCIAQRRLEQIDNNPQDVLVSDPNVFDHLRQQIECLYVKDSS